MVTVMVFNFRHQIFSFSVSAFLFVFNFLLFHAPHSFIICVCQVTWQSYDGMPESQVLNGPNPLTTYLITGLQRLTMCSIFVYATNEKGRGVDSDEMNISSSAVCEFSSLIDNVSYRKALHVLIT